MTSLPDLLSQKQKTKLTYEEHFGSDGRYLFKLSMFQPSQIMLAKLDIIIAVKKKYKIKNTSSQNICSQITFFYAELRQVAVTKHLQSKYKIRISKFDFSKFNFQNSIFKIQFSKFNFQNSIFKIQFFKIQFFKKIKKSIFQNSNFQNVDKI